MADMNLVLLTGTATKDATMRQRPSGVTKAEFSLEVDRPFTRANGEAISDLFLIDVYGMLAENCADQVKENMKILVVGTLNKESFMTRSGRREHLTVVKAKHISVLTDRNLSFGNVTLDELRRDQWGDGTITEYLRTLKKVLSNVQ